MAAGAQTGERVVLVVDDEHLIRWSLRERLEADGFRVMDSASGRDAVARAQGADLALVDYRLEDTDGLSVARALKAARGRRPVFLMTAYGSPELERRAAEADVERVIQKPFDLDRIAELVRATLAAAPTPDRPAPRRRARRPNRG